MRWGWIAAIGAAALLALAACGHGAPTFVTKNGVRWYLTSAWATREEAEAQEDWVIANFPLGDSRLSEDAVRSALADLEVTVGHGTWREAGTVPDSIMLTDQIQSTVDSRRPAANLTETWLYLHELVHAVLLHADIDDGDPGHKNPIWRLLGAHVS
jgi:hypothetical protein